MHGCSLDDYCSYDQEPMYGCSLDGYCRVKEKFDSKKFKVQPEVKRENALTCWIPFLLQPIGFYQILNSNISLKSNKKWNNSIQGTRHSIDTYVTLLLICTKVSEKHLQTFPRVQPKSDVKLRDEMNVL